MKVHLQKDGTIVLSPDKITERRRLEDLLLRPEPRYLRYEGCGAMTAGAPRTSLRFTTDDASQLFYITALDDASDKALKEIQRELYFDFTHLRRLEITGFAANTEHIDVFAHVVKIDPATQLITPSSAQEQEVYRPLVEQQPS